MDLRQWKTHDKYIAYQVVLAVNSKMEKAGRKPLDISNLENALEDLCEMYGGKPEFALLDAVRNWL